MKRFITILVAAIAIFAAAPAAHADKQNMENLANAMNDEAGGSMKVIYDGKNLVCIYPSNFFESEEADALSDIDDATFSSLLIDALKNDMGSEMLSTLGTVLDSNNADLVCRVNLKGKDRDILIKAKDMITP